MSTRRTGSSSPSARISKCWIRRSSASASPRRQPRSSICTASERVAKVHAGRPPAKADAEAMEPQDLRVLGSFFVVRIGRSGMAAEETKHYLANGHATAPDAREALEWARETTAKMVDLKFCDLLG